MQKNIIGRESSLEFEKINEIISAALQSVDPYECVINHIKKDGDCLKVAKNEVDLNQYDNIYLIGTGKAVLPMALAVNDLLPGKITAGLLIAKHENPEIQSKLSPKITILIGSHPIPSRDSVESTSRLVSFAKNLGKNDLVICVISGGGSSLMTLPQASINLEEIQQLIQLLLFSGASITEMNTVRKHLDQVKGGGLARLIWPARLITLVLSDVIGDPLDMIASGPTVADPTTFSDALAIIHKYILEEQMPSRILAYLKKGADGFYKETSKPGDVNLSTTSNYVIGSLSIAVKAAQDKAFELGLNSKILTTHLHGEAREAGVQLASILERLVAGDHDLKKPACLIAGGETTVTVKGKGQGGRNQEMVLSAAWVIQGLPDCMFISLATDGEDGPTDAAGAFVNGQTIAKGNEKGLSAEEFLNTNDAYHYLDATGSLIKIGPTGTNVNDLAFLFAF